MRPEITPEQAKEWREREQSRLNDGTYTQLPFGWLASCWYSDPDTPEFFHHDIGYIRTARFPDHFAHVSVEKVAMVAFTENDAPATAADDRLRVRLPQEARELLCGCGR